MNEFQFRIARVIGLDTSFLVPPLGLNRLAASGLTHTSILKIASRAVPFVVFMLMVVLMIAYVPAVSLLLLDDIY